MTRGSDPIVLGKITGHRGRRGELTVRVVSGDASRWSDLTSVLTLSGDEASPDIEEFTVESARSYRDRLVLKLRGIDDGDEAARLRGRAVAVPESELPALPEGQYWLERLIGMRVMDAQGGEVLGEIVDVIETSGGEVLEVVPQRQDGADSDDDEAFLIPLVRNYVVQVDEQGVRVRLPRELRDLNRREGP